MHTCGVCGATFEPADYQVVVGKRSYHSVDCAVRALEHDAATRPRFEAPEPAEWSSGGRTYSVVASLGRSGAVPG